MTQNKNKKIEQVFELAKDLYKKDQLAEARASLAAKGKSPRDIGNESRLKVILWIYRWGYTTSTIIQMLVSRTSGGYANKLCVQGWLLQTKTASGVPTAFYTLTEQGLSEAECYSQVLYHYKEINPYKVEQLTIRHNILAQSSTLNSLNAETIISHETERMLIIDGDKSDQKRPDVVWTTKSQLRIGIEIELSAKWGRDLDEFISKIAHGLSSLEDKPSSYSRFSIISDSPAIIDRYKEAVKPGALVSTWKKSPRNHWVQDKTEPVPDWLASKIDFYLIKK